MRRGIALIALGLLLGGGTVGADHQVCPAAAGNGRVLVKAQHSARWSKCVYGPPSPCGTNAEGWPGEAVKKTAKRLVCVYAEPPMAVRE